MTTRVDIFLDYVCPFCFLVEPAVEELKRERGRLVQGVPSANRLKKIVDQISELAGSHEAGS